MKKGYKWFFRCIDNGGKRQAFQVTAPDKTTAINKGFEKAKKNSRGEIFNNWSCELNRASL